METKSTPPGDVGVRAATPRDAAAICAIYNHYVLHTWVTFEEEPVSTRMMATRIRDLTARMPWLVAEAQGRVVGYAYGNKWKDRAAYRHSSEVTVYLDREYTGRGIGMLLYTQLIAELRARGFCAIIGGIALPNAASQRLHEKIGFKKVAHFEGVGLKFGKWIDVGYWQLTLSG